MQISRRWAGRWRAVAGAVLLMISLSISFVAPAQVDAAVDTCTWLGTTSGDWGTAANWSCASDGTAVPTAGDSLTFPAGASNKAMNNNLSSRVFVAVDFPGGTGYSIGGNRLEAMGNLNVSANVTFTSGVRFVNNATAAGLHINGANPTFPGDIDLDLTGSGYFNVTTTNATTVDLPVFTGTTTSFQLLGVADDNLEAYRSSASPSTFTADFIETYRAGFTCRSVNCFGDDANPITVTGDDDPGAYVIFDANGITFSNPITSHLAGGAEGPNEITVAKDMTLSGELSIMDNTSLFLSAGAELDLTADVSIDTTKILTFMGSSTHVDNVVTSSGVIEGNGGIVVDNCQLTLQGDNTYSGPTTVKGAASSGLLVVEHANGLGSTATGTAVETNGMLYFDAATDQTIAEPITLAGDGNDPDYPGALVNSTAQRTLSGTVTLSGDATIVNLADTDSLLMTGVITGTGDLTFLGDLTNGGIWLGDGSGSANTYSGETFVDSIDLTLAKTADTIAIPGDITIIGGVATASVVVLNDEQINNSATVNVDTDVNQARFIVNNTSFDTVGTIIGDGRIQVFSGNTLQVGGGNKSGTFAGEISGATGVTITKQGAGTWNLTGTNVDDGSGFATFNSQEGKLSINGADTSFSLSPVTITSNGVLGGTELVGPVTNYTGTIAPGNSPGCLYPAGDVAFTEFSTYNPEIAGAVVCSGYDRLNAAGTIYLENSTLDIDVSYASTGASYTIMQAAAINGTFADLADGATFIADGRIFRINYTATTVVLTDLGAVPTSSSSGDDNGTGPTENGGLANTGVDILLITLIALSLASLAVTIRFGNRVKTLSRS